MAGPSDATPVAQAQLRAPPEIKSLVDFLRGKNGPKVRTGILNGKRVEYFKGKTAVRVLQGPAYQKAKKVPEVKDEAGAMAIMEKALPNAFFLRVDRPTPSPPPPSGTPKTLLLAPQQSFLADAYYVWFYDGSPLYNYLGAAGMVLVIFAGVLFPLWPATLRLGVWYLSILALGFIGALIVLAIVRLIFYVCTVVGAKTPIWIFPNLFEDVGFIDSFIPAWEYELPRKKKSKSKSASSSSLKPKRSKAIASTEAAGAGAGGAGSVVGDLTGAKPVLPDMQAVPAGAEAAGSSSAAGAGAKAGAGAGEGGARSTGVQAAPGAQGAQGAGARSRQVTMEEAEDE